MKRNTILFILISIVFALLALFFSPFSVFSGQAATDNTLTEYAEVANAGFTFLEILLTVLGVGGGGAAVIAIRVARKTTGAILESLNENPAVDNSQLLAHAMEKGQKKAFKQFGKIVQSLTTDR